VKAFAFRIHTTQQKTFFSVRDLFLVFAGVWFFCRLFLTP